MARYFSETREENSVTIALLRKAIASDPNFAPPHGLTAACCNRAEALQRAEAERRASDGERLPLGGGDAPAAKSFFEALEKNAGGATGGYNRYWLDQGSAYTEVGGAIYYKNVGQAMLVDGKALFKGNATIIGGKGKYAGAKGDGTNTGARVGTTMPGAGILLYADGTLTLK